MVNTQRLKGSLIILKETLASHENKINSPTPKNDQAEWLKEIFKYTAATFSTFGTTTISISFLQPIANIIQGTQAPMSTEQMLVLIYLFTFGVLFTAMGGATLLNLK